MTGLDQRKDNLWELKMVLWMNPLMVGLSAVLMAAEMVAVTGQHLVPAKVQAMVSNSVYRWKSH